ncbi:MAG: HAD family hydrolase [Streptococcaceae bacterium]|nr:HAD family hydrolase [Streptococcaceae bacterium]
MTKELKLFATDMDGTFLRSDRAYNRDKLAIVLEQFDQLGWIFCASSGRQLLALEELFDGFTDKMAFVAENGGVVSYKNQMISAQTFSTSQIDSIIDLLRRMPFSPDSDFLISGLKGAYSIKGVSDWFFDKAQLYYANCQIVNSLDEIDDTLLKITTNFPEDKTRECESFITEELPYVRATTTGFTSIDIIPDGISKASGLNALVNHFGWTADNLAAFGDQMNDYEMLEYAGTSYAVSNATKEILTLADNIIGSNDEDAVFTEIERIISGK